MTDPRLTHDVAWSAALDAVRLFRWADEDERLAAFLALYDAIRAAIGTFNELKARELKRLARATPGEN